MKIEEYYGFDFSGSDSPDCDCNDCSWSNGGPGGHESKCSISEYMISL